MYRNAIYRRLVGEETTGTIHHPNSVVPEDSLVLTWAYGVADYPIVLLDFVNLTQKITIGVKSKVDGINYRLLSSALFPDDFPVGALAVPIVLYPSGSDWKITLKSSVLETAIRDIPYRYVRRGFA